MDLSKATNPQYLAELAEVYDKLGRSQEAVTTAQRALDLAIQQHDQEGEARLRVLIEGYQRSAAVLTLGGISLIPKQLLAAVFAAGPSRIIWAVGFCQPQ
ncbi:MAG TPA: hypothetical protein VMU05_05805 [Dongiaceae bacterium]|nr:hypothetical protein [Dongiaceae bacterium]